MKKVNCARYHFTSWPVNGGFIVREMNRSREIRRIHWPTLACSARDHAWSSVGIQNVDLLLLENLRPAVWIQSESVRVRVRVRVRARAPSVSPDRETISPQGWQLKQLKRSRWRSNMAIGCAIISTHRRRLRSLSSSCNVMPCN